MEDLGSMWSYQEGVEELKQKLLHLTLELESVKLEASQEITKNKENIRNLLNLLQMACKERDEAKTQLQILLNKLMMSQFQAESPLLIPTKQNSSITESNSFSDTINPQSHGSSPADSFFDAVSSPEFSNLNMADSNQHLVPEFNASTDRASMVIENLVKGKTLPENGKLLQAVMDAGPLLQTLLVAGPLPQWRNPPPLQPYKIPPLTINGGGERKPAAGNVSCRGDQRALCSTSMLNFSGGSCFSNPLMSAPSSIFGSQIPAAKRPRFH